MKRIAAAFLAGFLAATPLAVASQPPQQHTVRLDDSDRLRIVMPPGSSEDDLCYHEYRPRPNKRRPVVIILPNNCD